MSTTMQVQDLDVTIDGDGPTLVMLHGWPDSPALWDEAVASLRDRYRCVRFPLPGYDLNKPPRPVSVDEMCALVGAVVDAVMGYLGAPAAAAPRKAAKTPRTASPVKKAKPPRA